VCTFPVVFEDRNVKVLTSRGFQLIFALNVSLLLIVVQY
jgi:hypothetical protein